MTDPRIEHAAEVVRRAVAEVTFLGLDESLAVAEALRDAGWTVRRGDTFPGLDTAWVRIAVRDPHTIDGLLRELTHLHHRRTA